MHILIISRILQYHTPGHELAHVYLDSVNPNRAAQEKKAPFYADIDYFVIHM